MKDLEKEGRRQFLAKGAVGTVAAAALSTSCAPMGTARAIKDTVPNVERRITLDEAIAVLSRIKDKGAERFGMIVVQTDRGGTPVRGDFGDPGWILEFSFKETDAGSAGHLNQ